MKSFNRSFAKTVALRTAVAAAAIVACSAASAVSSFTFDPSKITGVSASTVTADTLTINDFAVVTGGATFSESGYLSVSSFNLNGAVAGAPGLNSTYGLYVSFAATGAAGSLTSLNYSVYGYSGPTATFGVTAAGATKSATTDTLLATGTLGSGGSSYGGIVTGSSSDFAYTVANSLTFANTAGAFSPISAAVASFVNTANQITPTSTGFLVNAGGGTINLLAAPVPEPETYALMLGGLAAVGFVARRRSNV